jgi:CheY-like chemotaxis protein
MPYGKVLAVDDVMTNLDVMKGLLLPYGLTLDCVNSGKKAIEKIRDLKE